MLKSFAFGEFSLDFCLGAYVLKASGLTWTGPAGEILPTLAGLITAEPSGERRQVMVEALGSIVPEGESVSHFPSHGGASVVFTSPSSGGRETLNLGQISDDPAPEKLAQRHNHGWKLESFKIVGLRALQVVQNIQDDYEASHPSVREQWEVLLESVETERWETSPKRFVLSLSTAHGMCGSGYTTASWSSVSLDVVSDLGPMTHKPAFDMRVLLSPKGSLRETFSSDVLGWSGDGGCGYYPSGGSDVDLAHFESTGRGFEKPLIHVFVGDSNTGKSTLGRFASGEASVYETDKSETFLPEMVYAQIIVLGGKHPEQTLTGVGEFFKSHSLDVELVPVRFGQSINFDEES